MLLLGITYALFHSNSFQNWLTGKLGDVTQKIKSNALSTNTSKSNPSSIGDKVKNFASKGVDKIKSLVS